MCCLKLIWKIVSHGSSLWVKWIETYLLIQNSFWSVKQSTSLGSWIWIKILKKREVAKVFVKVEVGTGLSTSFSYDDWSLLGRLIDITGARGAIDMGVGMQMTVAEAWKRRRRHHRATHLNSIEEVLHGAWQTRKAVADVVLWKGKNDVYKPKFSTKDTWNLIRTTMNKVAWHKGVWFTHATPKCSFCVWLAIHNRLSTGDRMLKWNSAASVNCVLCSHGLETRDHLFFLCPYGTEIWSSLAKGIFKTNYSNTWSTIIASVSHSHHNRVEDIFSKIRSTSHSLCSLERKKSEETWGSTTLGNSFNRLD